MKVRFLISLFVWVSFLALGLGYAASHLHLTLAPSPAEIPTMSFNQLLERNLLVTLALVAGFVTGGAATLIMLAFNGVMVGISAYELYLLHGGLWTAKGLVPHGLLEIPGFLIAAAVGLAGWTWMRGMFRTGPFEFVPKDWKAHLLWVGVACSMITVAGVIETYVTPSLLF